LEGLSVDVKMSLEAAGAFAAFPYGKKPWEAFGEAGRLMRWGPLVFRECMILRVIRLGNMDGHFEYFVEAT
jgi:hypothetical protein